MIDEPASHIGISIVLVIGELEPFVGFNSRFGRILWKAIQTFAMMDDSQPILSSRITQMCGPIKPQH